MYQYTEVIIIYGGVLSLFVEFSRTKNIKFVNIPIFGKKNRKIWEIEKLLEQHVGNLEKKLSDKNVTLILCGLSYRRVFSP